MSGRKYGQCDSPIVGEGGRNRPEGIRRGIGTHPSGITGNFSGNVRCDLCPRTIGTDSSWVDRGNNWQGEVRAVGGDVIRTSGGGSPLSCHVDEGLIL
jgi:hypothetical protein